MEKSANIGSLKFELLMDDQKFNASIQKNLQAAKDMNIAMSDLLNMRQQLSKLAGQVASQENVITQALRRQTQAINTERGAIRTSITQLRQYNKEKSKMTLTGGMGNGSLAAQQGLLSSLTSLATKYLSIWGATALLKNVMSVTAEFEMQRMALRAMLKDTMQADEVYGKIWSLALKSPFNAKELVTYAKQLAAYSIPVNQLYDTTKMLADVSSGLGVGMDRLVLAYGQIRAASFLRGQEVRQLTEAGIPILEELRKQFVELGEEGITAADVFDKISKRLVPFEMVEKVFKNMTSEGGKFYEMQEKQSETLKGKIMILKDAFDKMFNSIGENNSEGLKGMVDWVTSLARNYEKTIAILKVLVATYGAYRVTLGMIIALEKVYSLVKTANKILNTMEAMRRLTGQTKLLASAYRVLGAANTAKLFAGITGAVTLAVSAIIIATSKVNALNRELGQLFTSRSMEADTLVNGFRDLVDGLRECEQGSQDYRDAISQLNNKYGEYLPNLLSERNSLEDILALEKQVTESIYGRAKAYAYEEGVRKIQDRHSNDLQKQTAALKDELKLVVRDLFPERDASTLASTFMDKVREEIKNGKEDLDMYDLFRDFFGDSLSNYTGNWMHTATMLEKYIKLLVKMEQETQSLNTFIDDIFGSRTTFSSAIEAESIKPIMDAYQKAQNDVRRMQLPAEETENRLLEKRVEYLNEMIRAYQTLNEKSNDSAYNFRIKELINELNSLRPKDLNWIQEIVNPLANSNKGTSYLKANDDEDYVEYLDKLRKEYKSIGDLYNDSSDTYNKLLNDQEKGLTVSEKELSNSRELYELSKLRKETIEKIAAALGISLENEKKTAGGGKSEAQTQLEMEINTLKDLLKWSDKFKELGVRDADIKKYLTQFFPDQADVINADSYRETLLKLADALEKYSEKAAQALRDDMAGNGLDKIYDRLKAAKTAGDKLQERMDKLITDSELSGTGVTFDISKVMKNYDDTLKKIADEKKAAYEDYFKATSTGYTDVNINDFVETMMNWEDAEMNNALAGVIDSLDGYADEWVKEWARIKGIDLDDWKDMTIEDIEAVLAALDGMFDEDGNLVGYEGMEEFIEKMTDMPGVLGQFAESIKRELDKVKKAGEDAIDDKKQKKLEELKKKAKYAAGEIKKLADAFGGLAEATDSDSLKETAKSVELLGNVGKSVIDGYKQAGVVGALVGYLSAVLQLTIRNRAEQEKLAKTIREAAIANEIEQWTKAAEAFSGVFGEDSFGGLVASAESVERAKNRLKVTVNEMVKISQEWQKRNSQQNRVNQSAFKAYQRGVEQGFDDLGMFYIKNIKKTLGEVVRELNLELYDSFGIVDGDTIEKVISAYGNKISGDAAKFLYELQQYGQAYKESMADVEEVTKELFGQVAGDMTDAIIDRWRQMGDAAADYGDIIDGLTESLAKIMIKNVLLNTVFNNDLEEMVNRAMLNGDVRKATELMKEAINSASSYAGEFGKLLQELNLSTDGSAQNMGNAIQSVTEDTANLLGSYLNGMRADLAAQRMDVASISADMKVLLGLVPTSRSLEDYLMKIEANSFDTAQHTRVLMENISSMMTNEGGSTALRVYQ